uniref:RING-type domain-containing protein n=1 Tax=Otus sunia TaxID=257818 RepID=A0A8C8APU8_9STRI
MASETEEICPICRHDRGDVAYAMPCCHQFCLGCILRWIQMKQECPLCRELVDFVKFSGQGRSGGHQYVMTLLEVSPEGSSQAGPAPSHQAENNTGHPTASPPSSPQGTLSPHEQGAEEPKAVEGLLSEVWAELLHRV